MRKRIPIFSAGEYNIDLDPDVYCLVTDKFSKYRINSLNHISVCNKKGIKIPIWRIARRCWNKDLDCRYKDGNKFNLQRSNLEIVRKVNN